MKIKSLIFALLLLSALMACKKDDSPEPAYYPATLDVVTNLVQLSLDTLNNSLVGAGAELASAGADSATIRAKLQQLYAASSYAKEIAYINLQGIMKINEPPAYYQYQGADFGNDTAVMSVIATHQPVFSNYFEATEGFDAVVDIHPVNSGATSFGAIEALFTPFDLLNRIIAPRVSTPNEIWVLEMDGVVIYDPDISGIGANVFSDPYFAPFTSFIAACHTIIMNESGETSYTFYQTGTTTPVVKKVWWKTIQLHGINTWKIVWAQPE
jgi:hypothetical protein